MVRQGIIDAWDYWTNSCPAQEFMDTGRAQGHPTIGAAVDAYVVEMPGMWREWARLNAEGLEEIGMSAGPGWRFWLDFPSSPSIR